MKPYTERLPLIDAAIEFNQGRFWDTQRYFILDDGVMYKRGATASRNEEVCTRTEFENRARELGYKPKEEADMNNDWYKKGELPPVGDEVEVWVDNVKYWAKVKVLAVDGNRVVWRNGSDGASYIGTDIEFVRPIQSERDNLVESAEHAIESATNEPANSRHLETLIDVGWRPVKQHSEDEFLKEAVTKFGDWPSHNAELYRAGCRFVDMGDE